MVLAGCLAPSVLDDAPSVRVAVVILATIVAVSNCYPNPHASLKRIIVIYITGLKIVASQITHR